MSNTIGQMIVDLIEIEGGYVNHPNDHGGPTKYGITLKTLEAWRHKKLSYFDVKTLTSAEAAEIYEDIYYLQPHIDRLPDLIQPVVFDMAVNMGQKAAVMIMQKAVHKLGSPISADGRIGPRTCQSALIACNVYGRQVLTEIHDLRVDYYRDIVTRDDSQRVFLAGWENRAALFAA